MTEPKSEGMNKGTAIVGFILCFLAGLMVMYGYDHRGGKGDEITADSASGGAVNHESAAVPVSKDDPTWGSSTAPVTIVLFSDFQCPFCSRVEDTLNQVRTTYGKDKVRIVWKNNPLPFHQNAKPAAIAAATVRALGGNDAFWKFHDTAFKNQQALTRENFEKWAAEAGVDVNKFKAALDANTYAAKVDKDMALGQTLGVRGTPHSLINGIPVGGAQPFDKFKEVIDDQLKKAQALIASGTKPDQVYIKLTQENKAAQPAQSAQDNKPDQPPPQDDKTVWKVPVESSPIQGNKDAPVTLVLFSDFQCPFCKRVEDTLAQLSKDYDKKLRIVWKDRPLPFHNRAMPAAEMCREARKQKGDAGFWACHKRLFEGNPKLEDADLEGYAKELGLNWAQVKDAIEKKKYEKEINEDIALADQLKASGTPHMFINGRRLVGAQPIDKFKSIIDEEIKKAEALIAGGTPAAKVYDKIMETAQTAPAAPAGADSGTPEKKDFPKPTADNPWKGGKDAKVVLQIISDFQCPFCKRVEDTIKELEKKYGNKIKIVWRNKPLPFHNNAMLAAEAAMEAFKQKGSDGFWKYHDKLFENQSNPGGLERPALEKYAEELGLDMAKFKAALDNHTHKAAIEAESKLADDAGIRGTPGIMVNGYFIGGAQPVDNFVKVIDLALKEAK
jgi:protein-disulfide isomerase